MPRIKTSNTDKNDSTIKDLISHVSRAEKSLDGILSTIKNGQNHKSSEHSNNDQLGTALSRVNENLNAASKTTNDILARLTEIRNFLVKDNKTNLGSTTLDEKNQRKFFTKVFGFDKSKEDEQYGSIEKRDEKTKLLEKIAGNTTKKDKEKEEEKKEEKGGLLSKILGFAKKLILPTLAGLLLSGLKPLVKNLISSLFGGSDNSILGNIGDFVGETVADMLPGAIAGYMLTKNWRGALIGATISYGAARLRDVVNDITTMLHGEPREGAGGLKGYAQKALVGAMAGASLTGWKRGSFKAAMLGAGIGIATEWILNRVNEIRGMFMGDQVEIKTVAGIPESVVGGLIGGAILGHQFGGWKGLAIGAIVGGSLGFVTAMTTDFNNRLQDAKKGNYTEPKEICGIPYSTFLGVIAGAGIGFKFGGPMGMVVGAAVGGIAGLLYNWGSNLFMKNKANDAQGKKIKEENKDNKILQGVNAQKQELEAKEDERKARMKELTNKVLNGKNLTAEEKEEFIQLNAQGKQLNKIKAFNEETDRRLGHFKKMDLNDDGKVTKEELKKYKEDNTSWISRYTWNGSTGRSIRRYEDMLEGKDAININDVLEKSAEKAKLDTQNLPTANQIASDKTNEEQLRVQKEQLEMQREGNENMEKLADSITTLATKTSSEEENDGAYSKITASGAGQRRSS